jgi:hypothetical protein
MFRHGQSSFLLGGEAACSRPAIRPHSPKRVGCTLIV